MSQIKCVHFLVNSGEYFPPFCTMSFSISFRSSGRCKLISIKQRNGSLYEPDKKKRGEMLDPIDKNAVS